jgi:hypothetical protein
MAAPQTTARPSTTIRLIHGSFVVGIVLFAIIVHFVTRPTMADVTVTPIVIGVLLAVSLAASGLALVLRRRVPTRNTNESADLFWTTAATPALIAWAPLEGGALMGIVAYMLSGMPATLVVAGIALAGLIAFRPARFERN